MTGRSAPLIAHIAFFALLLAGIWMRELTGRRVVVFLLLWLAGLVGLSFLTYGALLFTAYVAVLDVVLVLMIFKGDVTIGAP